MSKIFSLSTDKASEKDKLSLETPINKLVQRNNTYRSGRNSARLARIEQEMELESILAPKRHRRRSKIINSKMGLGRQSTSREEIMETRGKLILLKAANDFFSGDYELSLDICQIN